MISEFDYVFWMGDFNYRIETTNSTVKLLLE